MLKRLLKLGKAGRTGSENDSRYPPGPLKPGEFRLLYLERPRDDDQDAVPQCTLHTFSLASAPKFRALSYTCGPAFFGAGPESFHKVPWHSQVATPRKITGRVYCNGVALEVYPNLADALDSLLYMGGFGWLWVDALCIRQDDDVERASQVGLMGSIYSRATEVLIWLGSSRSYRHAFTLVSELSDAVDRVAKGEATVRPDETTTLDQLLDETWQKAVGVENIFPRFEALLAILLFCRWFTRLWCAQELILAKSAAFVLGGAGGNAVPWRCFVNIVPFLIRSPAGATMADKTRIAAKLPLYSAYGFLMRSWHWSDKRNFDPEYSRVRMSPKMRETFSTLGTNAKEAYAFLRLANLLAAFRETACSDPRDKIFALRAMASQGTDEDLFESLPINYRDTVEHVYTKTTTEIFIRTRSLDMLCNTGPSLYDVDPTLPSWVPDYRQPILIVPNYNVRKVKDSIFEKGMQLDPNAAGLLSMPFTVSNGRISCSGIHFDVVEQSIDISSHFNANKTLDILQFLRRKPSLICGRRPLEVFHRSLTLDCGPVERTSLLQEFEYGFAGFILTRTAGMVYEQPNWTPEQVHAALDAVKEELVALGLLDSIDIESLVQELLMVRFQRDTTKVLTIVKSLEKRLSPFQDNIGLSAVGRHLFWTRRGLLGFGCDIIVPGDQIWVLAGASVPFILRPAEKDLEFRFQGDCFILDHMHGEILSDRYDVRDNVQEIAII